MIDEEDEGGGRGRGRVWLSLERIMHIFIGRLAAEQHLSQGEGGYWKFSIFPARI